MQDILDRAASEVGGSAKLAVLLGVSAQVVSNWRARGVPLLYCARIEEATSGAVRRWDLRPLDWHRIWPELIGADGAPDAPEPTTQPAALDAPVSQAGALDAA